MGFSDFFVQHLSVCLSVRLSVCPSIYKHLMFLTCSPESQGSFLPNSAQRIIGRLGFKYVIIRTKPSTKGRLLRIYENVWGFFCFFFKFQVAGIAIAFVETFSGRLDSSF